MKSADAGPVWGKSSTSNRVWITAKTTQRQLLSVQEVPRGSEHPNLGLAVLGRQESHQASQGLIPIAEHADLPATLLQLLATLICTLSSRHSYACVRKTSECKDYT